MKSISVKFEFCHRLHEDVEVDYKGRCTKTFPICQGCLFLQFGVPASYNNRNDVVKNAFKLANEIQQREVKGFWTLFSS